MKQITDYSSQFFNGRKVLVRVDYNVPLKNSEKGIMVADDSRIRSSMPTLRFLIEARARVILLSHLGRPQKDFDPNLSLAPIAQKLNEIAFGLIGYKKKVLFSPKVIGSLAKSKIKELEKGQILLLENLRFYPEEEINEPNFTKRLARLGYFYVNDAFSVSHRFHASIVGLPRILPSAAGLALTKEVNGLRKILDNPLRPVVLVVGGIKEDKLKFAGQAVNWADKVLLGGLLPAKITKSLKLVENKKIIIGNLRADKQDLTKESLKEFQSIIKQAGTVIFAGPISNVDKGHWQGTRSVLEAAIEAGSFLVAGGGDTEAALTKLNLIDSINYIVSGGGAMLDFLNQGTLPGIEALKGEKKTK